jgi:hypothetical protein
MIINTITPITAIVVKSIIQTLRVLETGDDLAGLSDNLQRVLIAQAHAPAAAVTFFGLNLLGHAVDYFENVPHAAFATSATDTLVF